MSVLTSILQPVAGVEVIAPACSAKVAAAPEVCPRVRDFGDEQMESLVRQVFFSGSGKPARHIMVSAVDESAYIAEICMDMAKALASLVPGSVCVIEGNEGNPELESVFGNELAENGIHEGFGFLRNSSQRVGGGLWLAPHRLLCGTTFEGKSPAWLQRRFSDFRLEFDYTIVHAPCAGKYSEASLLGRLSDGVILVIEADATRRVTAQRAKDKLVAANGRLLGVVLSQRSFPIPEEIYRRL